MRSLGHDPIALARAVRAHAASLAGGALLDDGPDALRRAPESPEARAFEAVLEAVFLTAAADGRVTREETEHLGRITRDLTAGALDADALETLFEGWFLLLEARGFHARAKDLSRRLDEDTRRLALALAAAVALGDGVFAPEERDVFRDLCFAFDIDEHERRLQLRAVAQALGFQGDLRAD